MNALQRLQSRIPAHIVPHSRERMEQISEEFAEQQSREAYEHHHSSRVHKALGHSGIGKKHRSCQFENYITNNQGQRQAYNRAKNWCQDYLEGKPVASFVFSGTTGTGKNHLACAIANNLMARKRSVVVITVADLMLKIRDKYNPGSQITEAQFIKYLGSVDLLVLDEVGVQRMNDHEAIMLSSIIDARYTDEKPTGILTNLNTENLTRVLGQRVIERLMENGGEWITFSWESYRKRKVA